MTEVKVPKVPLIYCGSRSSYAPVEDFGLPFGLPDVHIPDPCDEAIDMLGQLLAQLSFLNPIVKIAGCILSVIDVLKAIPDSLGPPPSPKPLLDAMEKLGSCIVFLSDLTMATPSSIRQMLGMIRGIIGSIRKAFECVAGMLAALVESSIEAERLSQSGDESLRAMGQCLREENETLKTGINDRLKKIEGLIVLINVLLATVGPLIGFNEQIPSAGDIPESMEGVQLLLEIIEVLRMIESLIPRV